MRIEIKARKVAVTDDLRERVARRGRAEVLARHTYAHRASRLLGPTPSSADGEVFAPVGDGAGVAIRTAVRAPRFGSRGGAR